MVNWIDAEVRLQQHAALAEQSKHAAAIESTVAAWAAEGRMLRAAQRQVRGAPHAGSSAARAKRAIGGAGRERWRATARALRYRAAAELWKPRWRDAGRYRAALMLMLAVALFSSALRAGFSGDYGLAQFLATVLLFVGIQLPIFVRFRP